MNDIIIEIANLRKIYSTNVEDLEILKNITLNIEKGSKVSIIGESGSGKSTLLNVLGGLDTLTSGHIHVAGKNLETMTEEELTKYRSAFVGFIFQFHFLLKDFTALENVLLPAYMTGLTMKQAKEKAMLLIKEVGLEHRINHYPSQLSGGERQRLAIVRALINDPEIILADEPTGNLDNQNALSVQEILFTLVKNYGKTLILVTHDYDLAKKTDVIYHLENGIIIPNQSVNKIAELPI